MAKQKTKTDKKRKPKGKKLSDKLAEKDAQKRADEETAEAARADERDDDANVAGDPLASEPPPSYQEGDDDEDEERVERDRDEEDEERVERDRDEEDVEHVERDRDNEEDDDDSDDEDDSDDDDSDDEEDDEDEAAAQMGHQRYVIAGFFGLWIIAGFLCGNLLEALWSRFAAEDWFLEKLPALAAVPFEGDLYSRATISLVVGALVGGLIVMRYYRKPDVRTWADEVAEQLAQVKWPTRKEVSQNTVVVMIATAMITAYLALLDRFWDFLTTMIYTSGT
jgi:preprotein translocase subunit SecE